jgi:hypothetical protein
MVGGAPMKLSSYEFAANDLAAGSLLISSNPAQHEIHNQHIETPEVCSPAPRIATP